MGKVQLQKVFGIIGNAHDCINKMHDFTIVKTESIDGTPFSDRIVGNWQLFGDKQLQKIRYQARETYYGKNSNDDTVGRDGWR